MTVEDVLSIEAIGGIALTGDGKRAAVVVQRARKEPAFHGRTRLGGDDRADVWVVDLTSGESTRITKGKEGEHGYWSPSWSADGARLAMLTSEGNDNAHLCVWSAASGAVERVVEGGIHLGAAVAAGEARGYGFVWIDNTTLLTIVAAPGFRPFDFGGDQEAQVAATRAWEAMTQGREATASALTSGAEMPKAATASVVRVNVATRQAEALAPVDVWMLTEPKASLAPGGRHLAVFEDAPPPIPAVATPMKFGDPVRTRVGIVALDGDKREPRWIEGLARPGLDSVRWSPEGAHLTGLSGGASKRVVAVDLASGGFGPRTVDGLAAERFAWAAEGRLLVKEASPRGDWFLVETDGAAPKCVTASLPEAPSTLTECGAGRWVAVVQGDLWRVDAMGTAVNLTARFDPVVREVCARQGPGPIGGSTEVVLALAQGAERAYASINVDAAEPAVKTLAKPSPHATVEAHWPSASAVAFRAEEDHGAFAWVTSLATGRTVALASVNTHLASVAPARKQIVEYTGLDGAALKASVLLPHDFQPGVRLPVLTWVYGGTVVREPGRQRVMSSKYSDDAFNFLPLVARGYAVLVPSMPLTAEGAPSDPLTAMAGNVLPAVDKLIELGIADPGRLAVGGHSYGGYSTYGVLTQSSRFKAAIVAAGACNLASAYGTLDARFRYGPSALEGLSRIRWAEGGQGRMGTSPFADEERYRRNSPVFFVDKIETPILILHGDMDFVPIQQAEELFSGLLRQGKKARFVRYFGEGHSIESPANRRHLWGEIVEWLDEHLTPPASRPERK